MPSRRRFVASAFCAVALLHVVCNAWFAGSAQAADKTLHVGILSSGRLDNRGDLDRALVEGLRQHGYVEGRNLIVERRYDTSTISVSARELGNMKLDAIVTNCTGTTWAASQATSSTPIVMVAVSDPVGQKLIESLARPGGNVTGLSSQAEDLLPKRLELLASFMPKSTLIAVLGVSYNPVHVLGWKRMEAAAQQMNIKLLKVAVSDSEEIPPAIEAAARANAGALFVLPDDPLLLNSRLRIVALAAKHRLPDFYWAREFVESGGLISYGENLRSSYRNAAVYIDKIAKGANPAILPVEQPTRFELVINMKTAKSLGLTIPQSLLLRANDVIQ